MTPTPTTTPTLDRSKASAELARTLAGGYLLVQVSVSRWDGRVLDKRATAAAETTLRTRGSAGAYWKRVLAGADAELVQLNRSIDRLRAYVSDRTAPFCERTGAGHARGPRLLALQDAIEVLTGVDQHIAACNTALDAFLDVYQARVEEAAQYLGDAFDPRDYPSLQWLRSRYAFAVTAEPVPTTAHLDGASLPAGVLQACADRLAASLQTAQEDTAERVLAQVTRVLDQIAKLDNGVPCRLHESLISDTRTLAGTLRAVAVGDPRLHVLADRLASAVPATMIPDYLRHSTGVRGRVRVAAEAVRDGLAAVFPRQEQQSDTLDASAVVPDLTGDAAEQAAGWY